MLVREYKSMCISEPGGTAGEFTCSFLCSVHELCMPVMQL